jgi:hypothetical protein
LPCGFSAVYLRLVWLSYRICYLGLLILGRLEQRKAL